MHEEQPVTINLIDVGAAGDLPEPWNKRRELIGNILRFEPREKSRKADNVISMAAMLWDTEEERNFYIYGGFGGSGSSLFLQNYGYVLQNYETLKKRGPAQLAETWLERSLPVDVQRVQCRTLDNVLRELHLPFRYHFLKIDAQGAEHNILKGAEHFLKNDCYGLHLELFTLPLYKGIKLFAEVAAYLETLGFELVKKYPPHGTFDSQHDCVFLKRAKNDPVMTAIRAVYNLAPAIPPTPSLPGKNRSKKDVLLASRERLGAFQNIHAGQRCVIIGNGPSLNKMDLSFLEHEICFGMNKIFLLFDTWKFRPAYYASVNPLVIEQSIEEILQLPCPKFLSRNGFRFFDDPGDIIFIDSHPHWAFSKDPRHGLHEGWTVTFFALQLAYFMGFSEVVLIGVDHHFVTPGDPNKEVVSQGDDPNHFHPGYFGKGASWNLPDLERSERSYRMAKEAFEADGRHIIDATVGGKLAVFTKADYRDIFSAGRRSGLQPLCMEEPRPSSVAVSAGDLPVNRNFLEKQREFWNVGTMEEAMFHRVYTDPAIIRMPAEEKIAFWNKSVDSSLRRLLDSVPAQPDWKVLEIGCGVGRLIKPLRERFAEVDGVDISENMIAFARQYLADGKQNGRVLVNSGCDLRMFSDSSYDFVFSMIVFQHIRSISVVRSYFQEIYRVLKPGGYFKLQVHRGGIRGYGNAGDEADPDRQYGFFGNGYHEEDLQRLLDEAGLLAAVVKPDGEWLWATAVKPSAQEQYQYLVSAIVSTYNSEKFIRGCLEDLVAQTLYQNGRLEIIVIDSGSEENEESVVREFQARYSNIVYLKTPEREGIYAAWNRGVRASRARYLTNANTDDRHHPQAFERMAQALDDDPMVGLVYADSFVTRDENAAWGAAGAKGVFRWPEFDLRLLYDICFIGPHPMWRASLHHEHGYFDERFVSAGDYEFWLRLASHGVRMRHIPETLGLYLERDSSVSLSNLDRTWEESELARNRYWPAAWGKRPRTQWRSCEEPLDVSPEGREEVCLDSDCAGRSGTVRNALIIPSTAKHLVETNYQKWANYNWGHEGHEWSGAWGSTDNLWKNTIYPRIQYFINNDSILEIAPGFGRMTRYLVEHAKKYTGVDLVEKCVAACAEKFKDFKNASFYKNDGFSLNMIADNSVTFVFSWDSFVHMDAPTVGNYLAQISRKLKEGGTGFIHHSNIGQYYDAQTGRLTVANMHWRSEDMTAEVFRRMCDNSGLACVFQEQINWGGRILNDCLSCFVKKENYKQKTLVKCNHAFMDEANNTGHIEYAQFYKDLVVLNTSCIGSSKRILLLCDYFWPSVGGVEALVEDLGARLRDKGYTVAFAVRHMPERNELERHGIAIHQFACNGDLYSGLTGDIEGYQQFLISSKFDAILILSQPDNWVSLGLYRVRDKISSKIIFLPSISRADIERWQRRGVEAEVEAVIRSADTLVVVTEDGYDARYAAQKGIPAAYIPHSIDVTADPDDFRTRHNLRPDKPLLAVVANFWPVKNHAALLRVLRRCDDDWQIVLIGNPVAVVQDCYEKVCAEAARDSRVRIIPGLPREQAAAAIRDADLLLVPSQAESAGPLVILQAMQYGTPWIATPHCNGVYSEPGGVIAGLDKFPAVIKYLLGNPDIRTKLGRQGKEGYAACFSWDKTLDAYTRLIENKSAVPDLKLPEALREQKWRLQDTIMQAVTGDLPAGRTFQEIQGLFPKKPVPGNKFGMIEVNGIKGFLEDKEMQQLYNRALNLRRGGVIIEIGSFMGLSAYVMARALLESCNYNARIYCIDWWTSFKDKITPEYRSFYSVENFKANLCRTGIERMITIIDRKSPECADLFDNQCADMVFIDGDHSLEGCLKDLEAWYPKVKPGGVLIGHDYTWTESVRQAVHAFVDRHQLGSRFCAPDKGTSLFCIAKPVPRTEDTPAFSVIIPTHNRSAILEKCLAALAAQEFEPSKIEVLVCDDGSSDATEQVVNAFSAPWPLFYLRQEQKGPASARNLGIKKARGEYLLFLNDDAILDKHALAIHHTTHMARRGEKIAVLGRFTITPEYRQTPFGHLLDSTDVLFNYARKASDEYYNYNSFYTCNISLPRQAVMDAGMFDESFTAPAAEDIDLGYRLHQKGWRVFYKDICIAFHDHRLKIADFCATHRMRGYWRVAMLYKHRDAALKWLSDEDYRHIRTAIAGNAALEAEITQLTAKVEAEDRSEKDSTKIKKKAEALYPLVKKIQLYHEIQGYLSHPYYEVLFNPRYRETPLVSVVVPCYNHGRYLRECVESIVRQTFQDFEIIIVNDGSTDDSCTVARRLMRDYPDHRIRILDQPNSGQPAIARNNGIAVALGKYILPLDADDWIVPDALAAMVAAANAHEGSEVVVYGYMQKFGVKNNVWPTVPCNRDILPRQNQLPNASLYTKRLWKKIGGYNRNVPGYEDWDFWIRASQAGAEFVCLERICIMYRTTESTSMLDRAGARHEHNVANIIMNSPTLYDPVERAWAEDYLKTFPEPPEKREPFDPNEKYAVVRAALIVHAFAGIYSAQEKAQAYRYFRELTNRSRPPVVAMPHARRGMSDRASGGKGKYKVLFVCHDFPPFKYAGAQLFALNLAKEMILRGHDVRVLHPVDLSRSGPEYVLDPYTISNTTWDGIPVYQLSVDDRDQNMYQHPQFCFYHQRVEQQFKKLLERESFDIVHYHLLYRLSSTLPLITRELGIPSCATLHDYWLLCALGHMIDTRGRECTGPESPEKCAACINGFKSQPSRELVAFFNQRMRHTMSGYHAVDYRFSPSAFLADVHQRYGFARPEVLPLGWLPIWPLQTKQPGEKIVLGYAGQIISRKGLDVLIHALSGIPSDMWQLVIYGENHQPDFFNRIMSRIKDMPAILYKGPFVPTDLPHIYSEIDVAVVPSRRENYPLTVLESLSAGVPVIASDVGGVREMMVEGRDGFIFPSEDVYALRALLMQIINNPSMIIRLKDSIKPPKTIAQNAAEYMRFYDDARRKSLIGRPSGPLSAGSSSRDAANF